LYRLKTPTHYKRKFAMQKYKILSSAYTRNALLFLGVLSFLFLGMFFFSFNGLAATICFGAMAICTHKICQPFVITIAPKRYNVKNIVIKGKSKEIVLQPESDGKICVLLVTILYDRKNELGLQYAKKIDGGAYRYNWATVGEHLSEKERQVLTFDKLRLTPPQAKRFYYLITSTDTDGTFNANYIYNALINVRKKESNGNVFRLIEKIYFDIFLHRLGLEVASYSPSPTTEERAKEAKTPLIPYNIEKKQNQNPITDTEADTEIYLTKRVLDDEPTKTVIKKRSPQKKATVKPTPTPAPATAFLLFCLPTLDSYLALFIVLCIGYGLGVLVSCYRKKNQLRSQKIDYLTKIADAKNDATNYHKMSIELRNLLYGYRFGHYYDKTEGVFVPFDKNKHDNLSFILLLSPTVTATIDGFLLGILFAVLCFCFLLFRLAHPKEQKAEKAQKEARKRAILTAMLEAEIAGNKQKADYLNDLLLSN
jgi:hypothetical protein